MRRMAWAIKARHGRSAGDLTIKSREPTRHRFRAGTCCRFNRASAEGPQTSISACQHYSASHQKGPLRPSLPFSQIQLKALSLVRSFREPLPPSEFRSGLSWRKAVAPLTASAPMTSRGVQKMPRANCAQNCGGKNDLPAKALEPYTTLGLRPSVINTIAATMPGRQPWSP